MKVRALNSFSDSVYGTRAAGDEFELPDGADWLTAGFVVPVEVEPEAVPVVPVEVEPEAVPVVPVEVEPEAPKRKKKG